MTQLTAPVLPPLASAPPNSVDKDDERALPIDGQTGFKPKKKHMDQPL